MQEKWDSKQTEFIKWLALPKASRKPKTVELLAKVLDVDPGTLWRWKQLDGFQDAVNTLVRATVGTRLSEVYAALLREAEKGSFPHIKLVLELSGDYKVGPSGKEDDPIHYKFIEGVAANDR